ncbi:hypothetical protein A4X09_0g6201, partial [Tilletia walkeri]
MRFKNYLPTLLVALSLHSAVHAASGGAFRRALPFGTRQIPTSLTSTASGTVNGAVDTGMSMLPPLGLTVSKDVSATVSATASEVGVASAHAEAHAEAHVGVEVGTIAPGMCNQFTYVDAHGKQRKAIAVNVEADVEIDFGIVIAGNGSVAPIKVDGEISVHAEIVAKIIEQLIVNGTISVNVNETVPGINAPATVCPAPAPGPGHNGHHPHHHHPHHP